MFLMRCVRKNLVKNKIIGIFERTLTNNISSNYIIDSGRTDLDIPNITIQEYATPQHCKYEKFTAIECAETKRKYTFGEIRDASTNFSKSLKYILKLETGDVFAIVLRNLPEYPIIHLGIMKANLIVSPISAALTPEFEERLERKSNIIMYGLLEHPSGTSRDQRIAMENDEINTIIESIKPDVRCDGVKIQRLGKLPATCNKSGPINITSSDNHERYCGFETGQKNVPIIVLKHKKDDCIPEHAINYHEFIDAKADQPEIPPCDPSEIAMLPYSSGTTGLPKGVELTHRNLLVNIFQNMVCDAESQTKATDDYQEVVPTILPYSHIFGYSLIMGAINLGAKMISLPSFSQDLFISVLRDYKSTMLYLVPPLVLMLTYHDDEQQFIQKFGSDILFLQGYGLTETSPSVASLYPRLLKNKESYTGSIGRPIPNTLVKIVNPDDPQNTPLGPNLTGELLIKGPQVMKGYHNKPEETKKVFTEDGWFKSGDLGHFNKDGFLFITDRLKELIKVKGHQVPPAELEAVIRSFPGVAEAAVIGIPHEISGEVPRAYIIAEKGLNVQELNEFVNSKVARYKQLKGGIEIVDTLPKSPSGKILKKELKETYLRNI
ncbi:hypothetical protein HHI36_017684 [Cryptolaemus montrouzieri]|uniref:4-coumarate--CoA ligase n=1 Tax=Cryptolaemus montrouzieri TaxID=559131 RepID=A0ABD2NNK8_9CUCU